MVEAVHRDIKMVVVSVGDLQIVALGAFDFEVHEAVVAADAVFVIDDQFARHEVGEKVDGHAALFLLLDAAVHAEDVLRTDEDHGDRRIYKSARERPVQKDRHAVPLEKKCSKFFGAASRAAHDVCDLALLISLGDHLREGFFVTAVTVTCRTRNTDADTSGKSVARAWQNGHGDHLFFIQFDHGLRYTS